MSKIYRYIKEYLKEDFDVKYYLSIVLFLGILISIETHFSVVRQLMIAGSIQKKAWTFFAWVTMYSIAYYGAMGIYSYFKKDTDWFYNKGFWLKSGLTILILSLYGTSWLQQYAMAYFTHNPEIFFAKRMSIILQLNIAMFLPVILFYFFKDKKLPFLYGMTFKNFDYRMYLPIILLIIPGVLYASSTPHFQEYYPVCNPKMLKDLQIFDGRWAMGIYELLYASTFIGVEALFRGLLVMGMMQILGKNAIIPMCCLYCSVHFSKPLGEILMSAPGGFILGILAYRTQNIIGGIWVHLSIALGMEICGALLF